jgi:hypothetical protein
MSTPAAREQRRSMPATPVMFVVAAVVVVVAMVVGAFIATRPPDAAGGNPSPEGVAGTLDHASGNCAYWVAPTGDDDGAGSRSDPWATLEHAAASVPDRGCTVWFAPGTYDGGNHITRRFTHVTAFRSRPETRAVLEHDGEVIDIDGGRNIVIQGFEMRHSGPAASRSDYVAIVDRRDDTWSERITFADNVFHDSYGDDLLKIHNGTRVATVTGNVFYNQGEGEQHIDVNSVTDVVIWGNIFFNDFAGSGREDSDDGKHFIVVKDSNGDDDGLEGSQRVTIRGNVFLNWEGGPETFIKAGNDGMAYYEAQDVLVESNLLVGNSPVPADAAFGVRGARNIVFNNNTVVGDLPANSYAYRIHLKDDNPRNESIVFTNNIWSDPTGTMGWDGEGSTQHEFSNGESSEVSGLFLNTNLYWNGGAPVPAGTVSSPMYDDPSGVVADPRLPAYQSDVVLPRWTGQAFASGGTSIHAEFVRLVEAYGTIPTSSPAVGQADPDTAATRDILGRARTTPDLGAFEAGGGDG